jgi:pimeloyl-ACP methyl ester carboxylesterase
MEKPTLMILPGLLEDADAFTAQIEALREKVNVVVADLTRAETIADLAKHALKQAPAGKFSLAGHSMGGYVALEVMRQAPERVERLALLNTHARPDSLEATQNRRRLMELAEKDFPAVVQTLMQKLVTEEHLKDLDITGTVTEMALGIGKEAFVRQEKAIIGRIDSRPHLPRIKCRTLVIAARQDQLMAVPLLEELSRSISRSTLAIVEDSGHMASVEQPAEVAELLAGWLET